MLSVESIYSYYLSSHFQSMGYKWKFWGTHPTYWIRNSGGQGPWSVFRQVVLMLTQIWESLLSVWESRPVLFLQILLTKVKVKIFIRLITKLCIYNVMYFLCIYFFIYYIFIYISYIHWYVFSLFLKLFFIICGSILYNIKYFYL